MAAQLPGDLQPGDSVRFEILSVIEFRDASCTVTSLDTLARGVSGTLPLVDGDPLAVDQGGERRRVALTSIQRLRVLREIDSPRSRGFKRGAVAGGLVGGAVGALAVGILGALFAPRHRWESVQVALPVASRDGSVAFGVRVAMPR